MVKAAKRKAAARAREGRAAKARLRAAPDQPVQRTAIASEALPQLHRDTMIRSKPAIIIDLDQLEDIESDSEAEIECGYTGGVNHTWSDEEESDIDEEDRDEELTELGEKDLPPVQHIPEQVLFGQISAQQWREAQRQRRLGYNGLSIRTKQRKEQKARKEREERLRAKTS